MKLKITTRVLSSLVQILAICIVILTNANTTANAQRIFAVSEVGLVKEIKQGSIAKKNMASNIFAFGST